MKDMQYVLTHFFTHKDFLAAAEEIPGTMGTPLHLMFEAVLLAVIVGGSVHVARHKEKIRPTLGTMWAILVVWEFVIIAWESLSGMRKGIDLAVNLSLYPCSLYLYTMPFLLWGRGVPKKMAYGYICTLGMLGAVVNFLYPVARLTDYSCISFAGFHTFFFHGAMLFTFLVLVISGMHRYSGVCQWQELFLPCVPSLLLSIPANLINYSKIQGDYMYFRGQFPLLAAIFGKTPAPIITLVLYALYIGIPALFYLPSYLHHRSQLKTAVC